MAITPYLYYEDVDRALKFLAKAFGFRKHGAQMRGSDSRILVALGVTATALCLGRKRARTT